MSKEHPFDKRIESAGPVAMVKSVLTNNKHRLKEIESVSNVLRNLYLDKDFSSSTIIPNQVFSNYTNRDELKNNNTGGIYFTHKAINDLDFIHSLYQAQPNAFKNQKRVLIQETTKLKNEEKQLLEIKDQITKYKKIHKTLTPDLELKLNTLNKKLTKIKKQLDNLKKQISDLKVKPFNYLCYGRKDLISGNIFIEEINVPGLSYYYEINKCNPDNLQKTGLSKEKLKNEQNLLNLSVEQFLTSQNPEDISMEDLYLIDHSLDYFHDDKSFKSARTEKIVLSGTTADQQNFHGFNIGDISKNIFRSNTKLSSETTTIYTGAIHLGGLEKKKIGKYFVPNNVECVLIPYTPQKSGHMSKPSFKLAPEIYNVAKAGIASFPDLNKPLSVLKTIPCNRADMPHLTSEDELAK